jgi:hypothetical protein
MIQDASFRSEIMIKRATAEAIFVSRKTICARLEISMHTLDTWLRSGFIPGPNINRGQIQRWHWPSIEEKLSESPTPSGPDPSVVGVEAYETRRALEKQMRAEERARLVRVREERAARRAEKKKFDTQA